MSVDLISYRKKSLENFILFVTGFGVKWRGIKKSCLHLKEISYQMVMENHQTVGEIAEALNMSRSTIYRYIEKRREWVV